MIHLEKLGMIHSRSHETIKYKKRLDASKLPKRTDQVLQGLTGPQGTSPGFMMEILWGVSVVREEKYSTA
jgi:hypothetical protein